MIPRTAAGWVARRLPVADDDHRVELAESVATVVAGRPRCERAWEAASLVGLWLRLWGRREGGDDAHLALRQGVYLGGILLALLASADAWRHAGHLDGAGTAESVAVVAVAGLASAAAALAAGGWRVGAIAASAGSTLVGSILVGSAAKGAPHAVGLVAVAAAALLAGDRFGARRCWRGLAVGGLAAGVVAGLAFHAPVALVPFSEAVLVASVPLGLLCVGWFDPRFAVAATTTWLGAFVAGAALEGIWVPALSRWWVMGAAVVSAAQVSRAALRRAFAV